jgi:hypothetical protein
VGISLFLASLSCPLISCLEPAMRGCGQHGKWMSQSVFSVGSWPGWPASEADSTTPQLDRGERHPRVTLLSQRDAFLLCQLGSTCFVPVGHKVLEAEHVRPTFIELLLCARSWTRLMMPIQPPEVCFCCFSCCVDGKDKAQTATRAPEASEGPGRIRSCKF